MLKQLTEQISNDLNITRYSEENLLQYYNRLIFSAMVSWAECIILDEPQEDLVLNENRQTPFHSVSRKHLTVRLAKILGAYLEAFSFDKTLIINSDESIPNIASKMIDLMIFTGVLIQLNDNRIVLPENSHVLFGEKKLIFGYRERFPKDIVKVGCGTWRTGDEESRTLEYDIPLHVEQFYQSMMQEVEWGYNAEFKEGYYEYFLVGSKGNYANNWRALDLRRLNNGIYLAREILNKKNYSLLKIQNGRSKAVAMDQWYYTTGEIYRFEFMLNYQSNSPAEFLIKPYNDHMELKCTTRLPKYERRILFLASWPKQFWMDEYQRIIPCDFFPIVESQLTRLGIRLRVKK